MRKLLVASQKGGVGKTTSSINLAAGAAAAGARVLLLDADPLANISCSLGLANHPGRRTLRQAGIPLPGVLVADVVPGLDVLSPYDDGGCSDEEFNHLLGLLGTAAVRAAYGCLVVDTPPFLGASPAPLLATCDEYVVVMRAEPMAYRTLPALMELAQRSKTTAESIQLRGVLLTLPQGEEAGGRWERELRGRLGTRILPIVIPHDEAASEATLAGRILCHETRETPAAASYHAVVELLALAADAASRGAAAAETLRLAFAEFKPAARSAPVPTPTPAPAVEVAPAPRAPTRQPAPPLAKLSESDFTMIEEPPAPPVAPSRSPSVPKPAPPVAVPSPAEVPFPVATGLMWVGAAIVVGIGMRFAPVAEALLPGLVGLCVAGIVVYFLNGSSQTPQAGPAPTPPSPRPTPVPAPPPLEARNAAARRLSGLRRRLPARPRDV